MDLINFPLLAIQNTLDAHNYRFHYGKVFFETNTVFQGREHDINKLKELTAQYEEVEI